VWKDPLENADQRHAAEPSHHYATVTETIFSHPRVPKVSANERFVLEPNGGGCLVRYETEVSQEVAGLGWLARAYLAVANPLLVARSLRNNFRHVMKAAESEAARATSPRT
jgi:hypothetical protein